MYGGGTDKRSPQLVSFGNPVTDPTDKASEQSLSVPPSVAALCGIDHRGRPSDTGGTGDSHPRLLAILKAYDAVHPSGPQRATFFTAPASTRYPAGSRPIDRSWANQVLQRTAEALGYAVGRENPGLTFHAMRRCFKSRALDAGVPGATVDNWSGHILGINKHYYRPDDQECLKWIAKLPFGEATDDEITRATRRSR